MGETDLTVIIVNWNTREPLRDCLLCLASSEAQGAQVVVVDNASSDGSAEMVRRDFPQVGLVAGDRNLGFAAANNQALGLARGRYVLFLNPDTEVHRGAIEAMLRYLDEQPGVAVAGTTLLNPDGSLQPSCRRYYGFWRTILHNRVVDRLMGAREMAAVNRGSDPRDVDWMVGACLAVRRSVLEQVGAFDPDFFVYGEEIDLQFRIKSAGWRVVYVPSSGVVHHGGQSAKQAALAASLHDYRGRWLFVRKHYPAVSVGLYLVKTIAALTGWMAYWAAVAVFRRYPDARLQLAAYRRLLVWHLTERARPPAPAPLISLRGEEARP